MTRIASMQADPFPGMVAHGPLGASRAMPRQHDNPDSSCSSIACEKHQKKHRANASAQGTRLRFKANVRAPGKAEAPAQKRQATPRFIPSYLRKRSMARRRAAQKRRETGADVHAPAAEPSVLPISVKPKLCRKCLSLWLQIQANHETFSEYQTQDVLCIYGALAPHQKTPQGRNIHDVSRNVTIHPGNHHRRLI